MRRTTRLLWLAVLLDLAGRGSASPEVGAGPRYLASTICNREHISSAVRGGAACTARDKVIPVPWPNNTLVHQLAPTHVVVRRCSGQCHQEPHSCVATRTAARAVPVMLGRCPVAGGKCDKECARVEVTDELECGCGCRAAARDCAGPGRVWRQERCRCECEDLAGRRQCGERPGRVWDSSTCTCVCAGPQQDCLAGAVWDTTSCSCRTGPAAPVTVPAPVPAGQQRDQRESEVEQAGATWRLGWELVVIAALGLLVLLLSSVILALLARINRLTSRLRTTNSHLKVDKNLYSPCPVQPEQVKVKVGQELYSSDSEISDKQTDCSYCTDSDIKSVNTVTPPPAPASSSGSSGSGGSRAGPAGCLQCDFQHQYQAVLDTVSERSSLVSRQTHV